MSETKHASLPSWSYLALFLAFFFFYFWNLGAIPQPAWDEPFYLSAARAYLSHWGPPRNPEHPPLVKLLIAWGIRLFGDRPEAWRLFPVLGGALANTCVVYLVDRIGRRRGVALFVGACLLLDPFLFVHFRLAILEGPLAAWMMLALAIAVGIHQGRNYLLARVALLGLTLGLGLSSKWAMAAVVPPVLLLVLSRLRKQREPLEIWAASAAFLLLLPVAVLTLSYVAMGYTLRQTPHVLAFGFNFHRSYQQTLPIGSPWYEWFYSGHPRWYAFLRFPSGQVQALLATGNMVLQVAGQLLAAYALWIRRQSLEAWAVAIALGLQVLLYALKPLTFFHYMVAILPFIYVLMGVGIAGLFDRYGDRYRRMLQVDFFLLWLGAFLIFWNYAPFLWGWPVPEERLPSFSRPIPTEPAK